jgi:hypothetical protein
VFGAGAAAPGKLVRPIALDMKDFHALLVSNLNAEIHAQLESCSPSLRWLYKVEKEN